MPSSAVLRATGSILLLQFGSRLLSFALNQLLVRSSSPAALGVSTLGFDVIRDTSLFVLREGLRGAVLLSLLPVLFFWLWQYTLPAANKDEGFQAALVLYCASAVIEMLAEPKYYDTLVDWENLTPSRVRIEGYAIAVKTIATLSWLHFAPHRPALEGYGVGQLAYSVVLFTGFLFLSTERPAPADDGDAKAIAWALTKQGLIKQILTEGDKVVAGRMGQADDQGAYAVALNYGSLFARIIFQPIEESSRMFFATRQRTFDEIESSIGLFSDVCLFYTYLSALLVAFAPPYVDLLIRYVLGRRWSATAAGSILKTYCFYLPFLALNGISEAFFQSTAKGRWLSYGSAWFGVCSVAFLVSVFATHRMGMGSRGLIVANCVNMSLRIAFSMVYIRKRAADQGLSKEQQSALEGRIKWRRLLPGPMSIVLSIAAGFAVRQSEQAGWHGSKDALRHVGIGAVLGIACLAVMLYEQREKVKRLLQSRSQVEKKND